MSSKIRRIIAVTFLVAAIFSIAILPRSGSCENLRFVFLADSRSDTPTVPHPTATDLINKPVLDAINKKILTLPTLPEFVVFGGDMAYRGCYDDNYTFQAWLNIMAPLTDAGIKIYTALGNHELYRHPGSGFYLVNQQQFQQAFSGYNPSNGPSGYEYLAWSFTSLKGDAFFAALDPYFLTADEDPHGLGGNVTSTQLNWLADQVAQTKATHKFLFIHTPYYYVTGQDPDENSTSNDSHTKLWNLLDQNRFDFLACGHQHLYSRKAIDSSIPPHPQIYPPVGPWHNNVVQLLNGTCGAHPDNSTAYIVNPILWHVSNAPETYYFSVVDINGNQVTVTSYKGDTGDYTVFDTFTINQPSLVPASSNWSTTACAVVLMVIAFALIRRRVNKQA